jgi:hypothetical protein
LSYHLGSLQFFEVLRVKVGVFWGAQLCKPIFKDFRSNIALREKDPPNNIPSIIDL